MKEEGVAIRGGNNTVDISGDKHDITKRESYVTDVNDRVTAASGPAEIQGVIDDVKDTLVNRTREELDVLWPSKGKR